MSGSNEFDVLVVGAGAFGLSTALHLKRRGVASVVLIDKNPFPSLDAASNDTSRIVRPDYPDAFYANLGRETFTAWNSDPVFRPAFHKTGRIMAGLPGDGFVAATLETLQSIGVPGLEPLDSAQVARRWNGLNGPMKNWNMYYNPEAGWANARQGLELAMKEYIRLGGRFLVEDITSLLQEGQSVTGVYTASVAAGAYTPQLVPRIGAQIHPVGFAIAHWRLDKKEQETWKDHPVVDLHHNGYFFPPNSSGLMKMGVGMAGYGNAPDENLVSKPLRCHDRIPAAAEKHIRWILSQTAPALAEKEFFDVKVCWDGMTADGHWLISAHPELEGLYVAAGGSGHGYKFLPIIGKYIADLVDGALGADFEAKWRWREGTSEPRDVIQGRPIVDLNLALGARNELAKL
ncbi:hypothetical protein BP6252_10290 [Coleophoma cylindrospora]|uniref:FAD dependent oxidoreductase domain-containing protein n=1 Tax=Coleophoma cylindrospora TaxID=1849047 RepID=A0A3D8QS49_9HELO|nr:hypothetical protein BP6252_10290 [Coleophoma cylindrospora]